MTGYTRGPDAGRLLGGLCLLLAAVFGYAAPAALAAGTATASPELTVPSNVGDVAEMGISLDYGDSQPTVVILYLAFDNMRLTPARDYFETVPVDSDGNPVRDDDGNVQAVLSAVQSAPEVAAAGKTVDAEYYATLDDNVGRGGIGIVVSGLNSTPLPKGIVLTVAFRVLNGNSSHDAVTVYGVDASRPVIVDGNVVSSSASSASGEDIALTVADGSIALGCDRPVAPTDVTATQNKKKQVDIAWTGAAGLEYRVFRSAGADPLAAQALGNSWTTDTSFTDVTAEAPAVITSPGCFRKGVYQTIPYNYWVKSRETAGGCESDASAPAAEGWRSASKAAAAAAAAWPLRDPASLILFAMAAIIMALHARRARQSE